MRLEFFYLLEQDLGHLLNKINSQTYCGLLKGHLIMIVSNRKETGCFASVQSISPLLLIAERLLGLSLLTIRAIGDYIYWLVNWRNEARGCDERSDWN